MQPLHLQYQKEGSEDFRIFFSLPLHSRGEDFTVYRNTYIRILRIHYGDSRQFFQLEDSELLRTVTTRLMRDDAGVTRIRVHNYALNIVKSPAVSADYIVEIITDACFAAGYNVIDEPLPPSSTHRLANKHWIQRTYGRVRNT